MDQQSKRVMPDFVTDPCKSHSSAPEGGVVTAAHLEAEGGRSIFRSGGLEAPSLLPSGDHARRRRRDRCGGSELGRIGLCIP
jgi:hypothetical protein